MEERLVLRDLDRASMVTRAMVARATVASVANETGRKAVVSDASTRCSCQRTAVSGQSRRQRCIMGSRTKIRLKSAGGLRSLVELLPHPKISSSRFCSGGATESGHRRSARSETTTTMTRHKVRRSAFRETSSAFKLFFNLALLTALTVLSCSHNASAASWKVPPVDSSVRLNESLSMACEFNDLGTGSVQWRQYLDDSTDRTLFIDAAKWNAPEHYSVVDNGFGYTLVIMVAQQSDDSSVQCGAPEVEERRARVTVLVEPGTPSITLNYTSPTVGETVALTCTSTQGNPPPGVKWYRNGSLVPGGTVQPPDNKFGATLGILVQTLQRNDHGAVYRCEVENEAVSGTPVAVDKTLNVKYAPEIDLGQYNPKVLLEGTPLATLSCDTDANPAVQNNAITWYKGTTQIGSGKDWPIYNVDKSDTGEYECRAANDVATASKKVTVAVHYAPKLQFIFSAGSRVGDYVVIDEHKQINLTCDVDANPPAHSITWTKDGLGQVHQNASYVLTPALRNHTGNLTCTAKNTVAPSGGTTIEEARLRQMYLRVFYKPGSSTILLPPGNVIKDNPTTLSCQVDEPGDPAAWFIWTKLSVTEPLANGSSLSFNPARLSDNGVYVCTPENHLGIGTPATRQLDVYELPEWLGQLPPATKVIKINETGFSATCQTRGKPQPEIRWYRDGKALDGQEFLGLFDARSSVQQIDTHSWNVTSVLRWEGFNRQPTSSSLQYDDTGNYTCKVTSNIDQSGLLTSMQLAVHYAPVVSTAAEKVAIDKNQSAVLSCDAHSVPETEFEWYNGTSRLLSGGRVQIYSAPIGGAPYRYRTTLNISDIHNMDLGSYSCRGRNLMGSNQALIHLTVKDVPDPPTGLKVMSSTWESAELQWSAGFDGGYTQVYVIYYRYYNLTAGETREMWLPPVPDTRVNVTELYPSTNYTLHVYGQNLLGLSDPSDASWMLTDDFFIEPPTSIYYNPKNQTLVFQSPSTNYCARVELYDGSAWSLYEPCAPTVGGSIKIESAGRIDSLSVSLCLTRRPSVCSAPQEAVIHGRANGRTGNLMEEDLPVETIIIVACVCGGVVVVLTIVLIVLCCRRHKAKKEYEKAESNQMQTVMTQPGGTGSTQPTPSMKPKGLDNPGLDQPDAAGDLDDPRTGGVFATNTSNAAHPDPYRTYDKKPNGHGPNGYGPAGYGPNVSYGSNGYLPNGAGSQWSDNGLPPPSYDSQLNDGRKQRNDSMSQSSTNQGSVHHQGAPQENNYVPMGNKPKRRIPPDPQQQYLQAEPAFRHDHPSQGPSANSDSGVSTPDPQKPKKVIYEVIV